MKTLELDGSTQNFDAEKTFGVISEEVKRLLAPQRVLTEIVVDGRSIDLDEEEVLNQQLFKNVGTVVLKSRDVKELFGESLVLAPRICEALRLDCTDVDGMFERGEHAEAQDRIGEMTSLLEWLLQVLSGFQALTSDKIEEREYSKGKVIESFNRMQLLLTRLHLHLGSQNWTEFRAILRGEFQVEVQNWETLFNELA
ncbi:MAG TPA: hypothetical protein VEF04_11875, partial [Blastocatellia bacterium]|nr:hypothetical protein [Blastocatellia bacterium]